MFFLLIYFFYFLIFYPIFCYCLVTPNDYSGVELNEQAYISSLKSQSHTLKSNPSSYCAPYFGSVCKKYTAPLVFYNYSSNDEGEPIALNEQITQGLWSELISSLQEPCRSAAETLLCYYAFPHCHWIDGGFPKSKPLCKEDCIAVRESFCVREWALLEDNKQKGIYFKSRGHFRLPDCDSLPSHKNLLDPPCSHANLTTIHKDEVTTNCVKGRGRFYQGKVNMTKDGIPCQKWDLQTPHTHNRPPFVFPEIWNSENYCRNAGGEEPMPWFVCQIN